MRLHSPIYLNSFCQVRDDGKLPRTICPGCHIQLQATIQFFELLIKGQQKIRDQWNEQVKNNYVYMLRLLGKEFIKL